MTDDAAKTTDLGKRLLEARIEANYTQDQVSRVLDFSKQQISHWEAGRQQLTPEDFARVASLYGVNLAWLIDGSGEMKVAKPDHASNDDMRALGARLLSAREDANLSQTDVAKALNFSKQSVSHWEAGRQGLNIFDLKKVADLYGVSITWLISGGPDRNAA